MCLYSRIVQNPKYKNNKKNGGNIPAVYDTRVLYVPIKCGQCIECRKAKAREWQLRMLEEIKDNKKGKFITLTFSTQSLQQLNKYVQSNINKEIEKLQYTLLDERADNSEWNTPILKKIKNLTKKTYGYDLDNEIAITATRLFNERWRKKYKKAPRHWLVTELGHQNTEHIHLHGIIWTDESFQDIRNIWQYGYIWPREYNEKKCYVNEKTINYIIKYITKIDYDHKYYKSKILCSPGIGSSYTTSQAAQQNKFKGEKTIETYRTHTGHQIAMPIYWRNKIYSEEEREQLWIQKLNKQVRYIRGEKIDISQNEEIYFKLLKYYQQQNKELGYGSNEINWNRKKYEEERRKLIQEKRIQSPSAGSIQKG